MTLFEAAQPGPVGTALLLDLAPDLGAGVTRAQAAAARRCTAVAVYELPPGPWDPDTLPVRLRTSLGVVIVDGFIARELELAGHLSLELFGAGDIVNPWEHDEHDESLLAIASSWSVRRPAHVAMIDSRLLRGLAQWPSIIQAVVERAGERAGRLAIHQAISQLPRIELRILSALWYLAERWGRVATDAVLLDLPLTHTDLGRLVGAQRPTVSLAIKTLADAGLVTRRQAGTWVLHGNTGGNSRNDPCPSDRRAA